MPEDFDDRISALVRQATAAPAQAAANAAAADALAQAARREREELADKWYADQPILSWLAEVATRTAAGAFAGFSYRAEAEGSAGSLGAGRFVAIRTDGAQAVLHLDPRDTGRVALAYEGCDDDALVRELPLLSADEEAYARVILAFLAVLQTAEDSRR